MSMNAEQFRDRVVLVVGAATGMGRATAEQFAKAGANVVCGDVNPAVNDTFAQVVEGSGAKGFAVRLDVSSFESCKAAVRETLDRYGRIDVLVNLAGVIQVANDVESLPEEEWDRVLNVNLKGHFLMAKAAVGQFKKQRSGRIILITSIWGRVGEAYFAAYSASKGGLMTFTHALAKEMVEYGVTVNGIAPGMINTELHQKSLRDEAEARGWTYEQVRDKEWGKVPLGYAADAEDIAHGVMYLASDEARYVTGANVDINGGILMR
jgi:NAD(P)-dependent dehydrogenase (short-subunit alcohol dehydrogenase family)